MWRSIPGVMRWNYIYHAISEELLATQRDGGGQVDAEGDGSRRGRSPAGQDRGDMEKARFGEFAKLYLNLTNRDVELPKTLEDIRDIYDKIALDEIDDKNRPDGAVQERRCRGPRTARHRHPQRRQQRGADISAARTDDDLARSDTIPFLQRAIASHFLFEYIHPFYDGNGRTGRYLLALYLSNDLTLPTVLSLSRTIAENKNEYYKAFTEARGQTQQRGTHVLRIHHPRTHRTGAGILIESSASKSTSSTRRPSCVTSYGGNMHCPRTRTLLLYAVMQEELFDTTKSMTHRRCRRRPHADETDDPQIRG